MISFQRKPNQQFSMPLFSSTTGISSIRTPQFSITQPRINSVICKSHSITPAAMTIGLLAAATVLSPSSAPDDETFSNVPQQLSGQCVTEKDCKKQRIQRPRSRKAERCTSKCVTTCIRGGDGSPGEGPLNLRGPIVVFKEGFRSRKYCLVECSEICNLLGDRDDGP